MTPLPLSSPVKWGGRGLMDFLGIVKFFTPTFDLPCKIGKMGWEKIETDTPTFVLPREMGRMVEKD